MISLQYQCRLNAKSIRSPTSFIGVSISRMFLRRAVREMSQQGTKPFEGTHLTWRIFISWAPLHADDDFLYFGVGFPA